MNEWKEQLVSTLFDFFFNMSSQFSRKANKQKAETLLNAPQLICINNLWLAAAVVAQMECFKL